MAKFVFKPVYQEIEIDAANLDEAIVLFESRPECKDLTASPAIDENGKKYGLVENEIGEIVGRIFPA